MGILRKTANTVRGFFAFAESFKEWGLIDYLKDPWKVHRGFTKEMVRLRMPVE